MDRPNLGRVEPTGIALSYFSLPLAKANIERTAERANDEDVAPLAKHHKQLCARDLSNGNRAGQH
ncbi:hypothetical protein M514_01371 [Trichuris suis]|uniref:Uncharacterized protein n=1 Tax=Trichuris suis TaxID=68888 RepID=A0A085MKF5_9BILA|nr:hypothetical protein M513_01371 [Trichuris suis]KFD72214.1 hypothetical protein M514_01371 [Trichuris suis]